MNEILFDITPEMEGERIDKCICAYLDSLSRSYIQKIIKDGNVFVNDIAVKSSYKVVVDDQIRFQIPDAVEPDIQPEDLPIPILYEDDDVLVIDKPKNMVVHPAPGHYSGTVVNFIMHHCKGNLSGINGVMRPGIVHRIDKDTTGSLIICKNDEAHQKIADQLKVHSITRKYRAIVYGRFQEIDGIVDAPIGRHPTDRKKMAINELHGKHAVTHYHVITQFEKFAYIECELETGRTHQIRVHMSSIGHPLLGDDVYCNLKAPYHLEGQCLHAYILGFQHPKTNEYIECAAPIPEYFEELLKKLK